jgi:CheY-like chemotaxis protein
MHSGTRTPERVLSGVRVLVVEDEDDARELVTFMLTLSGADVRAAASADEALHAIEEFEPSVLVSDISMPGHDGYWLVSRVKSARPNLPCLAVTALTHRTDVERSYSAGFARHLCKPFAPEALVSEVASVVKRGMR